MLIADVNQPSPLLRQRYSRDIAARGLCEAGIFVCQDAGTFVPTGALLKVPVTNATYEYTACKELAAQGNATIQILYFHCTWLAIRTQGNKHA